MGVLFSRYLWLRGFLIISVCFSGISRLSCAAAAFRPAEGMGGEVAGGFRFEKPDRAISTDSRVWWLISPQFTKRPGCADDNGVLIGFWVDVGVPTALTLRRSEFSYLWADPVGRSVGECPAGLFLWKQDLGSAPLVLRNADGKAFAWDGNKYAGYDTRKKVFSGIGFDPSRIRYRHPPLIAPLVAPLPVRDATGLVKLADCPRLFALADCRTFVKREFFQSVMGESEKVFAERHVGIGKTPPGGACTCQPCSLVKEYCAETRTYDDDIGALILKIPDGHVWPGGGTFNVITAWPSEGDFWASQANPWRPYVDVAALQAALADPAASVVFQAASRWHGQEGGCKNIRYKANPLDGTLTSMARFAVQGEEMAIATVLRATLEMYFELPYNMLSAFEAETVLDGAILRLPITETGGIADGITVRGLTADQAKRPDVIRAFCNRFRPRFVEHAVVTGGLSNIGAYRGDANSCDKTAREHHVHVAVRDAAGKPDVGKSVCQVLVAALDLDRGRIQRKFGRDYYISPEVDTALAQLLLHASYEGTLRAADIHKKRILVMTGVGTGSFKDSWEWVLDALERMRGFIQDSGLQVILICPAEPVHVVVRLQGLVAATHGSYLLFNRDGVHTRTCGDGSQERARRLWAWLQERFTTPLGTGAPVRLPYGEPGLPAEGDVGGDVRGGEDRGFVGGRGDAGSLANRLNTVRRSLEMLQRRLGDLSGQLRVPVRGDGKGGAAHVLDGGTGEVFITLVHGDMTKQYFVHQDQAAIVNAANAQMLGGGGIDGAIHVAAMISMAPEPAVKRREGTAALYRECFQVPGDGNRCPTGQARLTWGHGLAPLRIIHTAGPICSGDKTKPNIDAGQQRLLSGAYTHSLGCADVRDYPGWSAFWRANADLLRAQPQYLGCTDKAPTEKPIVHVAFPCISTAIFNCNMQQATNVAVDALLSYLTANPRSSVREVRFVTFDQADFDVYERVLTERVSHGRLHNKVLATDDLLLKRSNFGGSRKAPRCFVFNR